MQEFQAPKKHNIRKIKLKKKNIIVFDFKFTIKFLAERANKALDWLHKP